MPDLLSTLFSVLFTVYIIIAVLGGSAFLLKAAYMPHVTKHYFEHVTRDNGGTPWSRFFSELARISVLWPLWLLALATQSWWRPKLAQSEQRRTDPPGSVSEPLPGEPPQPTEPPNTTSPEK